MAHTTRSRPQGSGFSGGNSVLLTGTRGHFYRPEAVTFEWASEPMTPDAEEPAEGGLRAWKQRPGTPSSPSGRRMAKVAEKGPVKECPEQLLSSTRRRHLVEAKPKRSKPKRNTIQATLIMRHEGQPHAVRIKLGVILGAENLYF